MPLWKLPRAAVWPLVIALVPSNALAANVTVNSGQTLTTTQDIGSDSTAIIEEGAAITISDDDVEAIEGTDNNTVINYGTISSLHSGSGIHLEHNNSITNYGTIETSAQAVNVTSEDALDIHGGNNSIVNWGLIRVYDSINGYGVHISEGANNTDGTGNVLTNFGTIETTGKGSNAVHVETTDNTIINHGTIIAWGEAADGVYIIGGNTLINSGTLISAEDEAIHMHNTGSEVYLLAGSAVYGR